MQGAQIVMDSPEATMHLRICRPTLPLQENLALAREFLEDCELKEVVLATRYTLLMAPSKGFLAAKLRKTECRLSLNTLIPPVILPTPIARPTRRSRHARITSKPCSTTNLHSHVFLLRKKLDAMRRQTIINVESVVPDIFRRHMRNLNFDHILDHGFDDQQLTLRFSLTPPLLSELLQF
ncbi:hypothetical protein DSO57_1002302 [Entomophthora muscae]|uniref:Uncharacterized protein n=1 Tax=Entomophthora muscae TaxID=34485 RepID=A0ACC2TJU5_9FUNG|nr:hypothetical protein DSO57_1002302 [Entomophthora muscae]